MKNNTLRREERQSRRSFPLAQLWPRQFNNVTGVALGQSMKFTDGATVAGRRPRLPVLLGACFHLIRRVARVRTRATTATCSRLQLI